MLFLYALLCVALSSTSAAASTSLLDIAPSLFIPSSKSQRRSFNVRPVIAIRSNNAVSGVYRRPTSNAGFDDAASDSGHRRPTSPSSELGTDHKISSTQSSPIRGRPEWEPTSPEPQHQAANDLKGQPGTGKSDNTYNRVGFSDTASEGHRRPTSPSSELGTDDETMSADGFPIHRPKLQPANDLKSRPKTGVRPPDAPQRDADSFQKLAAQAAQRNKLKSLQALAAQAANRNKPKDLQKLAAQAASRNKPENRESSQRATVIGGHPAAPVTENPKPVDATRSRGGRKPNKPNAGPTVANDNRQAVKPQTNPVANGSGQGANPGRKNKLKKPSPPKTVPVAKEDGNTEAGSVTKSRRRGGKKNADPAPVANTGGQGANNSRLGGKKNAGPAPVANAGGQGANPNSRRGKKRKPNNSNLVPELPKKAQSGPPPEPQPEPKRRHSV